MNALLTDRYQLTMLAAYRKAGMHRRRAVFEAFVRRMPACRSFLLVAGVERAIEHITQLRFRDEELAYLASEAGLGPDAGGLLAEALRGFCFSGSIHAMPEGTVAFPNEPIVRVEGTLEEAQLVETLLLSILNHDIRIASKAVRCVIAAGGRAVVEFGSRRTHERAAVDAARAAYIAGFVGSSNEQAGLTYGVPVYGTVAHSFIMAHAEEGEQAAFARYCDALPERALLLVDTYDTLRGVERAIAAAGGRLKGIRLDSGNLGALACGARERLDAAGLTEAQVFASSDLNEYRVAELLASDAPIDAFGIGTELVCTPDMPALGAVYKLVEVEGASGEMRPVAKRSSGKATYPGAKQVFRRLDAGQLAVLDEVALADESRPGEPLLVEMVHGGERVGSPWTIEDARERAAKQVQELPSALKRIPKSAERCTHRTYPVERSERLHRLYDQSAE